MAINSDYIVLWHPSMMISVPGSGLYLWLNNACCGSVGQSLGGSFCHIGYTLFLTKENLVADPKKNAKPNERTVIR